MKKAIIASNETGFVYRSKNPLIRVLSAGFQTNVISAAKRINIDFEVDLGLDIGCADGDLLFNLSKSITAKKLVAVDIEHQKADFSQKINKDIGHCVCDAKYLPFQSHVFDYVMAMEVLEHIPDPNSAFDEIMRVAKKKAKMIVSVPNEPFFHLGNIARGKYLDRCGKTPSHVNFWSCSSFENFLSGYLDIVDSRIISCFPWQIYAGYLKN